jgi:transposase-like protein
MRWNNQKYAELRESRLHFCPRCGSYRAERRDKFIGKLASFLCLGCRHVYVKSAARTLRDIRDLTITDWNHHDRVSAL